jgi:hypothetical protein
MPAFDRNAVLAQAERWRLPSSAPRRGWSSGERAASTAGQGLEFFEHRAYAPGDDVRHLDWAATARSGAPVVRRHRLETAPLVELVVDGSASIARSPEKSALLTALAALLACLARADGARPVLWWCAANPVRIEGDPLIALAQATCAPGPGWAVSVPPARPGAQRFLLGDALLPDPPKDLIAKLGRGAGALHGIVAHTAQERRPEPLGAVHLIDAEGGSRDIVVDALAISEYHRRLNHHLEAWRAGIRQRGCWVEVAAAESLAAACSHLARAGLLIPA